jgi:PiT family inorganic phosphate transporter
VVFAILGLAVLFLAYANGANDNFKGVASLFGSETTDYRKSILWATVTTAAGSIAATLLAGELMRKFSGKGLVPDALISQPLFLLAVATGAGSTVLLASRFGFPISTTHGLTGALIGAGLAHDPGAVQFVKLWESFARPLLMSPVLAILSGALIYHSLRAVRLAPGHPVRSLNLLHFLSAGAVSFARGLNDTPKIAALALAIPIPCLGSHASLTVIGLGMALGGWLSARRVAETMSHKITGMNPGQGFAANLSTALLVTTASVHGLPVSTTHVSVGSLLGVGITTSQAKWHTVIPVLLSWLVTLPCSAGLSGGIFLLGRWSGL